MAKEVMERRAADNRYLHKGFHAHMNLGISYVREQYGARAVVEYLKRLARSFYAPQTEDIRARGLAAVRAEFERVYALENAEDAVSFEEKQGELYVKIAYCPAVRFLRESGNEPDALYALTTSALWREICEKTGVGYEMLTYDAETGAALHLFYERGKGE